MRFFCVVPKVFEFSGWAIDASRETAPRVRIRWGTSELNVRRVRRPDVQNAHDGAVVVAPDCGFAARAVFPVGFHRVRIDVEEASGCWLNVWSGWILRWPDAPKPLRAWRSRCEYTHWAALESAAKLRDQQEIDRHIELMVVRPKFAVVIDVRANKFGLQETCSSVNRQYYRSFSTIILAHSPSNLPDPSETITAVVGLGALTNVEADFVVFLKPGEKLAIDALYEFASTINQFPDVDLVYADEDSHTPSGAAHSPFHKPDWSPDYLEAFNYLGLPACFRMTLARHHLAEFHPYDFVLRFTEQTQRVRHIRKVLGSTVRPGIRSWNGPEAASQEECEALQRRIDRTGRQGRARTLNLYPGCLQTVTTPASPSAISIVIAAPSAGREKSPDRGMEPTVQLESVLRGLPNREIEVILVDQGELDATQDARLAALGCKRVSVHTGGVLNLSKMFNQGCAVASGEYLLLLMENVIPLTADWLERMLGHFDKPHVGAVGARIVDDRGRIRLTGVVHNAGTPSLVRVPRSGQHAGYFFSTCAPRNFSAVTAGCMMTPTRLYRELGGFDEGLPVRYNTVDYCQKIRLLGRYIVHAPDVEVSGMDQMANSGEPSGPELNRYQERWPRQSSIDPFYSEEFLDVDPPTFSPQLNPRRF